MDVNRSGYYKWKHRQIEKPKWIKRREDNLKLIQEVHNKRHIRAIFRRFKASFRKSFNEITSLSVPRFVRPPFRVLTTFLCQ